MKVKEILTKCADVCGVQIDWQSAAEQPSASLTNMLLAFNAVAEQIHSQVSGQICQTVVDAKNSLVVLPADVGKIVSLKSGSGAKIAYRFCGKDLWAKASGKLNLTYLTRFQSLSYDDDYSMPVPITERIVVFGTVAEYLRIVGRYNDAESFGAAYSDAMENATQKSCPANMPAPSWL